MREDGTDYFLRVQAFPVLGNDGKPSGFIEVVEDITQRKRTEEELTHAKTAAEAANRAKSEFLANMSHELRTPMTAILGFADILLENPAGCDPMDAAEAIQRNGEHLLALLNDILDLSKIEAGKTGLEFQACSPVKIVSEVLATMRVRADAKGLPLCGENDPAIPKMVMTDPLRLRQILVNLIGNAIKFTETGSVRVVTRMEKDQAGNAMLTFDVIDTGIGIADDQRALLFQPFSQVDASAGRRFGGTGLGLAISRRLARMLGGDITVSSVLGRGATFSVTIAVEQAAMKEPAERSKPRVTAPPQTIDPVNIRGRILLVEDSPDNQRLIAFLLRTAGAEVSVADNGQAAIDCALQAQEAGLPFDLIFMDMQMPILDGYEATQRLRGLGYRRPIVALTAHAMASDREKCLGAGCDDYLTKPINRGMLLQTLSTWMKSEKAHVE